MLGELLLGVQAVLRRGRAAGERPESRSFGADELVIDDDRQQVTVRGETIDLTPTERGLLIALAHNPIPTVRYPNRSPHRPTRAREQIARS
jgi:DNA-binding response OmpR family regulator